MLDSYCLRIDDVINRYKSLLLKNSNIVGFGRGFKIINNNITDIPTLTIYVNKKHSIDSLSIESIIPKYINGVLTDIEEIGGNVFNYEATKVRFNNNHNASTLNQKLLGAGMSIGNEENGFGGTVTCALIEKPRKDGKEEKFLLGCAHSLTKVNKETDSIGRVGDWIVNPAKKNKGDTSVKRVGRIADIAPLEIVKDKDKIRYTTMDAVLIRPEKNMEVLSGVMNGEKINGVTSTAPGVKVYYYGAISGKRYGVVKSINTVFEWSFKDSNNDIKELRYSKTIVVDGKFDINDTGAIGLVDTMSKGTYGFGMLVAGTENTVVFSDLSEAVNHFNLNIF